MVNGNLWTDVNGWMESNIRMVMDIERNSTIDKQNGAFVERNGIVVEWNMIVIRWNWTIIGRNGIAVKSNKIVIGRKFDKKSTNV
jgi:hypothetical protein